MKKIGFLRGILFAVFMVLMLASAYAQEQTAAPAAAPVVAWHRFGAAIGVGMIVIGAALGIGKFASAAAESIARQPAAAAQITSAVMLPLFLLEGVAIIAEVVVLLIVFK